MKHKCKKHCPCYLAIVETGREKAKELNSKRTPEQRSQAAKKGWEKRKQKV